MAPLLSSQRVSTFAAVAQLTPGLHDSALPSAAPSPSGSSASSHSVRPLMPITAGRGVTVVVDAALEPDALVAVTATV